MAGRPRIALAMNADDERELEKALARNIFEAADADDRAVRLARYVRAAASQLGAEADDAFAAGQIIFPNPEAFAHMGEHEYNRHPATPWQFPVALDDVPEPGERFELVADADIRQAVARTIGLRDLPRLEANLEVGRQGASGLRVTGRVSATVGQTCVVTLEPLVSEIEEDVDLVFMPRSANGKPGEEAGVLANSADNTEPLIDGQIDLGALASDSSSLESIRIRASQERCSSHRRMRHRIKVRSPF